MSKTIEKIVRRCDQIYDDNSNWRNYQEEINTYVIPRKAWVNTMKQRGERLKMNFVFDSTAIRALKIMAAGFHSNLTNPSTKWFNLRTRKVALMENKEAQLWFKEVEDIIFSTLNSSNFDTTIQEMYLSVGSAGTSAILTQRDAIEKVRFTEIPVGQLAFEEDASGRVNAMYRKFPMTSEQAYDKWGEGAGSVVLQNIKDEKPGEKVNFIHYVGPRDRYDPGKIDNLNMPWESVWLEVSKKEKIAESGYKEFPYAVARFYKDSIDPMGYSPSMDVLPDIKLASASVKTMLRAAMKQADPALIAPSKGFVLPLNSNPGAMNYRDEGTNAEDLSEMPHSGNLPITLEVVQMIQKNIESAFFVPLFQALSNITKTMTIPEIQRRIAENMVLLGPTVGRFTQDVLDNVILRVFSILMDDGDLPEPPEVLQDQELDIVYISPLAKAQRETEIYSIQAFLGDVAAVAQYKPQALDLIDEDEIVKSLALIRSVNPQILVSDDAVEQFRAARAEAEAAQAQMNTIEQGAGITEVASKADKNMQEGV